MLLWLEKLVSPKSHCNNYCIPEQENNPPPKKREHLAFVNSYSSLAATLTNIKTHRVKMDTITENTKNIMRLIKTPAKLIMEL